MSVSCSASKGGRAWGDRFPVSDPRRPTDERRRLVDYQHTQKAPLHWFIKFPSLAILALAWGFRAEPVLALILISVALLLFAIALCFGTLTVEDDGDALAIGYGPLPLFRARFAYTAIASAQKDRTSILDGWGVHWFPGRGLTYNLWGFDCVRLVVQGKTIRIGSDDVDNLVQFLNSRIPTVQQPDDSYRA